MRLTNDMRSKLKRLRKILEEMCHADGCEKVSNCPRMCGCRSRRTFKLNTETSMCWELADQIWDLLKYRYPTKREINAVVENARAYQKITRYHMTRGWQKFFRDLADCIQVLCGPAHQYAIYMRTDEYLDALKRTTKRLKRYPR